MNEFQRKLKDDRETLLKIIQVFHPQFDQFDCFRPYVQYEGLSLHGSYKGKKGIVNMTITLDEKINNKCFSHTSDTSEIKHYTKDLISKANIKVKNILNNAGYKF